MQGYSSTKKHRSGRHSSRQQKKGKLLKKIFVWAKANPLKLIALIFAIVLIYVTILFVVYDRREKTREPLPPVTTYKIKFFREDKV